MQKSVAEYLVIGSDGLIGRGVAAALRERDGRVSVTTRRRDTVGSCRQYLDLEALTGDWQPDRAFDAVFLCAGHNPKQCDHDPIRSRKVNVTAPLLIAERLAAEGTFVVKLSSNAVFDGSEPYQKPELRARAALALR